MKKLTEILKSDPYFGRGIIIGHNADGKNAVVAYFITGRSANSRNRIFRVENGKLSTHPADPAKVKDPSLIIYTAINSVGGKLIVTNGDQTDTIAETLLSGGCFEKALRTRTYEPDAPSFTPRISGLVDYENDFSYKLSIIKKGAGEAPLRYFFEYPRVVGAGRFLCTYDGDGNPLPSFSGEPKEVEIKGDLDTFANEVWSALDADNKISLYVRFIDTESGEYRDRIINKYGERI